MKSNLIILVSALFCFIISSNLKAQDINYKVGDTLNVVALNGLNIRKGPGVNFEKAGRLENGDKVIIRKITDQKDSIEFKGTWVEIVDNRDSLKGFAFDVFLSQYPVPGELEFKVTSFYDLADAVRIYMENTFTSDECTAYYHSVNDEKGYHGIEIFSYQENIRMIKHQYYEGYMTELDLLKPRPSESYYLIKNILSLVPDQKAKDYPLNDHELMYPDFYNNKCQLPRYKPGDCLLRVYPGGRIHFIFPCC